jgi:tetratricopeptide (TPR) repeat protein
MNIKTSKERTKGKGSNHFPRFLPLFIFILWAGPILWAFPILWTGPIAWANSATAPANQILIDSDDQFQFALQTLELGEYQRAVVEFERFIHFFPDSEKVPRARYLIGTAYLEGKQYETARNVLTEVYESYSHKLLGGKALLLIGESYFAQGISEEAQFYFKRVIQEFPLPELTNPAYYRLGWSRMSSNQWLEASETFKLVEKQSPLYPSALDLAERSLKGNQLSYKSPTTAGTLAIIPGLGHAYLHRYKDGLVALLLNGLTIWAAVEAFNEDLNVLGGLLVALEVGWYAGNIYSAVNGAHKYNKKISDDFRQNLPDRFEMDYSRSRTPPLGLSFKIEF